MERIGRLSGLQGQSQEAMEMDGWRGGDGVNEATGSGSVVGLVLMAGAKWAMDQEAAADGDGSSMRGAVEDEEDDKVGQPCHHWFENA